MTLSPALKAIHLLACVVLAVSVLLQAGKGTGLGAAFGVGASQTVFGAQGGAKFLSRITITAALVFFSTALVLAVVARTTTRDPSALPSAVDVSSAPAQAPAKPVQSGAEAAPAVPSQPSAPASVPAPAPTAPPPTK